MEYSFDILEAKKYGVDEAIMLKNFKFWIFTNQSNKRNYRDGRTWTYNTHEAFQKVFSFWTENQIRRILKSLINQGVILTGNYNDHSYDRTLWYALSDESLIANIEMVNGECRIASGETNKTTYTDNKPDDKTIYKGVDFDQFWNLYDKKVGSKSKLAKKWKKLTIDNQKAILEHIPKYKSVTPDKQYRKNPETYLNNQSWNDEIITKPGFVANGGLTTPDGELRGQLL
jgi:hypothetical protein